MYLHADYIRYPNQYSNHQQPFVYPMGDAKDSTTFLLLNVENTFQVRA